MRGIAGILLVCRPLNEADCLCSSAPQVGRRRKAERELMGSFVPTAGTIDRQWHVIDADGQVLGRVATEAARLFQGKHKPVYTPYIDTGDHVVVVNAARVA